jgi:acyl-CoA thioester hydrolase
VGGDVVPFPEEATAGADDETVDHAGDGSGGSLPPTEIKVRFHELDPYGHVNHGVYLNYFEAARIDVLDHLGIGLEVLRARQLHLIVVEANIRFKAPAIARDLLEVVSELTQLRPASSWWHQQLIRCSDRTLIAEVDVRTATADPTGRPTAVPVDILDLVRPYVTA